MKKYAVKTPKCGYALHATCTQAFLNDWCSFISAYQQQDTRLCEQALVLAEHFPFQHNRL